MVMDVFYIFIVHTPSHSYRVERNFVCKVRRMANKRRIPETDYVSKIEFFSPLLLETT